MKTIHLAVIIIFFLSSLQITAQPIPNGRRLRDIVADKYADKSIIIGVATSANYSFDTPIETVMDREFSYVTPENDFKHSRCHKTPDHWDWSWADAWLEHIVDNNQVLRIHGPVSPQCSKWAKEDSRTKAELEKDLRLWMKTLCQRYNGVKNIKYMDVINEVVDQNKWHPNKAGTDKWECPWYKIGKDTDANKTPLFIKYAFEEATEHAPDMKLIINQHGKFSNFNLIKTLVPYLRNRGLRVDGIGWQAHIRNGVSWLTNKNLNDLRKLIDWCHNNNLEFHITEVDVWIKSSSEFDGQANVYKSILNVLLEKRYNGVVGWNAWNVDDSSSWQAKSLPTLFNKDFSAKPAYYAIQSALENAVSINSPFINTPNQSKPQLIKIHSNPPILTYYLSSEKVNHPLLYQITNTLGRELYSASVHNNLIHIDLSPFPQGIYFLKAGSQINKILKY